MTTTHTPGPWTLETVRTVSGFCHKVGPFPARREGGDPRHACLYSDYPSESNPADQELLANARLIAAAPELLEALEEAVDLAWIVDSHQVHFDPTVVFGQFYDFSSLDGVRRIEFYGRHSCIVWPGSKWSAYCTYEGSMWFEKFDTAAEAKEACMRLLDKVLPDHPAMRARAAIAKAKGEQQ